MAQKKTTGTTRTTTKSPRRKTAPKTETSEALVLSTPLTELAPEQQIAETAYFLWESRGKPMGSPDEDWYEAKAQLERDRAAT